jgi:hypothetical protein
MVVVEVASSILLVAHLAHHQNLWTLKADMLLELSSGHVLELVSKANVATKLWTVELGMSLELAQSLPDDVVSTTLDGWTSMRKFTEINTVFQDLVYFSKKITFRLAIRAANIKLRCHSSLFPSQWRFWLLKPATSSG